MVSSGLSPGFISILHTHDVLAFRRSGHVDSPRLAASFAENAILASAGEDGHAFQVSIFVNFFHSTHRTLGKHYVKTMSVVVCCQIFAAEIFCRENPTLLAMRITVSSLNSRYPLSKWQVLWWP